MFDKLETNLKGVTTTVRLERLNAIVGGNRSGKTALLRAIQLAVTPNPPAAQAQRYWKLAPNNEDEAYAVLSGPTATAEFRIARDSKGKVRAPVQGFTGVLSTLSPDEASKLLPSVSLRSLLDLGDKKAREELFRRFGALAPGQAIPRPPALGPEGEKLWSQAEGECARGKSDPAIVLAAIGEWLRKEKLRLSKEVRDTKKSIDEARARVEEIVAGAELIPELEMQYKKALAFENQASARAQLESALATRAALDEEAEAFAARDTSLAEEEKQIESNNIELRARVVELSSRREQLVSETNEVIVKAQRIAAIDQVLELMILHKLHECPVCSKPGADPTKRREELATLLSERQAAASIAAKERESVIREIQALDAQIETGRQGLQVKHAVLSRDRASCDSRSAACDARISALRSAAADLSNYQGPTSAAVADELRQLREGEVLRQQLEFQELGLRQKKIDAELAKELEEKAERLLEGLLVQVKSGAEAAVNKYMPAGFEARIELGDGECSWCIVAPRTGESKDKDVMCGAEQASLIVALALAWTDGAPYRFVTLDDADLGPFHSSPENQRALLGALEDAATRGALTQVFVAGIRAEEVPTGWNAITR